jgi:hypothetical protein
MKFAIVAFIIMLNSLAADTFDEEVLKNYFTLPKDKILVSYSYSIISTSIEGQSRKWVFLIDENYDTITNYYNFVLNLKEKGSVVTYQEDIKRLFFLDIERKNDVSILFENAEAKGKTLVTINICTLDIRKENAIKNIEKPKVAVNKNKPITAEEIKEIQNYYKELFKEEQKKNKLKKEEWDEKYKILNDQHNAIQKELDSESEKAKDIDRLLKATTAELEKQALLNAILKYKIKLKLNSIEDTPMKKIK